MNIPIYRDACWRRIALQKLPTRPAPLPNPHATKQQRSPILPMTKWNPLQCPIHSRPNRQAWQPINCGHLPKEQVVDHRKTISPCQQHLRPYQFHRIRAEEISEYMISKRYCGAFQATITATELQKNTSPFLPLINRFYALLAISTTDFVTAGEGT